jgi:hypothetical protein
MTGPPPSRPPPSRLGRLRKQAYLHALDLLLAAPVALAALMLRKIRRMGIERLPLCRRVLLALGVFPVRRHYHEPLFDGRDLAGPLDRPRRLPGIDWDVLGQLALLASFAERPELAGLLPGGAGLGEFRLGNGFFEAGDAEIWYHMIRHVRPRRIIEIGSGFSTLVARAALAADAAGGADACEHLCIEPYEKPWLEAAGVSVLRQPAERVDPALFDRLAAGDILFIDSSHVIRPQGDVVFEFLELLPRLRSGVIVHVHDIFSPRDYPDDWVRREMRLWNEQYLVEAFLTGQRQWRVLAALNLLFHEHYPALRARCPALTSGDRPSSLYLQRL